MNEYITFLIDNLNENDSTSLLNSFQEITFLSSTNLNHYSLLLNPQFLAKLINYYLYELKIESVYIICHNIIADSNFNLDLLNVIIESQYAFYLFDNYINNDNFTIMLNMLIYKFYLLKSEFLHIFGNIIPFLIDKLYSLIPDLQLLAIDSLCNLSCNSYCLVIALNSELLHAIEATLEKSNILSFSKLLFLLNHIHEFDKSINIPNKKILTLLFYHLNYSQDEETNIMIKYLKYLITENTQFFINSDIINELLTIIMHCSFQKKKKIVFFFAQSFQIIYRNRSQIQHQNIFKDTNIKFQNTVFHKIISSIMETCISFDEEKCLFCLSIIKFYFDQNPADAYSSSEEVDFPSILNELMNSVDTDSTDKSDYAQILLSLFFSNKVA